MRTFFVAFLLFAFASAGAQKTETLTNASVINLHKAGLEDGLIISKIESSACKFDVSTEGLIALKKAGLSKEVIQAMMDKSAGKTTASAKEPAADKGSTKTTVAGKNVPEPETINYVHFYNKGTQAITPLERSTAAMKTERKMLGYGGVNTVYEIEGDKSKVRTPADPVPSFIVNTGSGPADIFVLYKVEAKKGKRKAIAAKFGMSGMKGSEGVITTDIKQVKPGLYELVPTAPLEKGEYFFANKTLSLTTSNADVYAFGVD